MAFFDDVAKDIKETIHVLQNSDNSTPPVNVDQPINEPAPIPPAARYANRPIPMDLRLDTARIGNDFISSMDRLYNEVPDPNDRDLFMSKAFNYYTSIEPNEILREIIDSQGAIEQGIMKGEAPEDAGYKAWQDAKKWLKMIVDNPYNADTGLV